MYGNIIFTCVIVLQALCVNCETIEPEIEEYYGDIFEDDINIYDDSQKRPVNSTSQKTVNKYYCSLDSTIAGSHLLVYGSNGWTFPLQDVNLTLGYPTDGNINGTYHLNAQNETSSKADQKEYLITGFKVILYIDGLRSQGYILNGGVLRDSISLSFVSSGVTSLRYQFWLYGVRKDTPGNIELNTLYRLCT